MTLAVSALLSDFQMTDNQKNIEEACDNIKDLLLAKNRKYGDSALSPIRVFSKSDSTEQILVRIDDKLSRIAKGIGFMAEDEDTIEDLIGYLILLRISIKNNKEPEKAVDLWDGSDIITFPVIPSNQIAKGYESTLCDY